MTTARSPKRGKTRDVPVPPSVLGLVDEHVERFPSHAVTLPWRTPAGEPITVRLLATDDEGRPMRRNHFNEGTWAPARKAAGIERPTRQDGTHVLRHFYASVLLDAGRASRRCRSTSATTTPGSRSGPTPMMPASAVRTRLAIDALFGKSGRVR